MMQASVSIDSLASHPRSSNFDIDHRLDQLRFLQNAFANTSPPPNDLDNLADYVPTSITMAGPGNYGTTEVEENGEEVVLLNDDVLTSVANATVVIIDGNDLERITVLYQFPQFLEHCPQESINVMVPRISLEAVSWSTEAQMAAAEALFFVVNVKVPFRVANQVACSCLQITSDNDNMQVFDACGEIVSTILPQIHRRDVLQNIVPEAIDRAVSSHPEQRRFAARIIGSVNDALNSTELDILFVKTALALSNDPDESVRALIAQAMASIGSKVPLSVSERYLWPRLRELIMHDTAAVKAAALRALAKSAEAHKSHCMTCPSFDNLMKPIFVNECQKAADVAASDLRVVSDDTYLILEVFSEIYGHFMCALAPILQRDGLWSATLNALRLMVTCNGPTVRHWCAFNMPAIASLCADDKSTHVNGVIPSLAGDSDLETRATLAAGIHEMTRSLRNSALRNDVIRAVGLLFMDENAQVRMNALGHFSDLLQLLSSDDVDATGDKIGDNNIGGTNETQGDGSSGNIRVSEDVVIRYGGCVLAKDGSDEEEMRRLAPMFSSLELMSFDSWRTQKLLALEVEKSAHLIPQEMLCEHVAPLLFQMARESTYLVRKASMRSLIHVLRYVPDVRRRNHILKHFKLEWAHGKVYWTRLAFVEASECAFKLFSLRLFTALFKDEVIALKNDRVVNVRLRLLRFFRDMVSVWKKLPEYRQAIDELSGDGDWQVSVEARDLRERLDEASERTAAEVSLDVLKERAESRFFKHAKHKKRKAKSRNGTLLTGISEQLTTDAVVGDLENVTTSNAGKVENGNHVAGSTGNGRMRRRTSAHSKAMNGNHKDGNNNGHRLENGNVQTEQARQNNINSQFTGSGPTATATTTSSPSSSPAMSNGQNDVVRRRGSSTGTGTIGVGTGSPTTTTGTGTTSGDGVGAVADKPLSHGGGSNNSAMAEESPTKAASAARRKGGGASGKSGSGIENTGAKGNFGQQQQSGMMRGGGEAEDEKSGDGDKKGIWKMLCGCFGGGGGDDGGG